VSRKGTSAYFYMQIAKLLSYTIFLEKLICGFIWKKTGKCLSPYTDSIWRVVSMKLLVSIMPNVAQPQFTEAAFNAWSLDPRGPARLLPPSHLLEVKNVAQDIFNIFQNLFI